MRPVGYLRFNEDRKCWTLSGQDIGRLSEVPVERPSQVEKGKALVRFRHFLEDQSPGVEFVPIGPDEFRVIYPPNEDRE
jgi:hypothetical protein